MSTVSRLISKDFDDGETGRGSRKVVNLFAASNIGRRQRNAQELASRVRDLEQENTELNLEVSSCHQLLRAVRDESIRKIRIISVCYSSALLFVLLLWSVARWVR